MYNTFLSLEFLLIILILQFESRLHSKPIQTTLRYDLKFYFKALKFFENNTKNPFREPKLCNGIYEKIFLL